MQQEQVVLEAFNPIDLKLNPKLLTWGGVTKISGMDDYDVYVMNKLDDLRVQSLSGEDNIQVLSITGPTIINSGADDDVIDVSAATGGQPGVFLPIFGPIPPDYPTELVIEAGGGLNNLTIDEVASPNPDTFHVTGDMVTSDLLPGVHYQISGGTFATVAVVGTSFSDTFFVRSTSTEVADTIVHSWNGKDLSEVGSEAGTLLDIRSQLTIMAGAGGSMTAILDDSNATSGNADVVYSGNTISGLAGPDDEVPVRVHSLGGDLLVELNAAESPALAESFRLDGFAAPLLIRGGQGLETFEVSSLSAAATLQGEEGGDYYQIGNDLGLLAATLTISDPVGNNQIVVDDSGNLGEIYELNDHQLDLPITAHTEIVLTAAAGRLEMTATAAGDQFRAFGRPKGLLVDVNLGGPQPNVLVGPDADAEWEITGDNEVTLVGIGNFVGAHNLLGGSENDAFVFDSVGQVSGNVIGSLGKDSLDYSNWNTQVVVDLAAGNASAVGGVALAIEGVFGGKGDDLLFGDNNANMLKGNGGNDILVGFGGDDRLFGGAGRDVIIGGAGKDLLIGNAGDDLLVGAGTVYDGNIGALTAIRSEWTRLDATYKERIDHLRNGGGLNGGILLNAGAVIDDLAKDVLHGQQGLDWFWSFFPDVVNAKKGEALN